MIKHGVIKWAPVYISSMGSKSEYPTVSFNGDRSLICDTLWCYVVPIKIQFNCFALENWDLRRSKKKSSHSNAAPPPSEKPKVQLVWVQ